MTLLFGHFILILYNFIKMYYSFLWIYFQKKRGCPLADSNRIFIQPQSGWSIELIKYLKEFDCSSRPPWEINGTSQSQTRESLLTLYLWQFIPESRYCPIFPFSYLSFFNFSPSSNHICLLTYTHCNIW
jgi:hypothetical protein